MGTGILHHEVQALLRIAGVQRLIGTAGLQYAERGDDHPLRAGNEDGNHSFMLGGSQFFTFHFYLFTYIRGNAVAQLVDLLVGIAMVLEHHSLLVGRSLCLTAEQRHDGLRVVVRHIGVVQAVQVGTLVVRQHVDVAQRVLDGHLL